MNTTRYVAFLRAINVRGHPLVKMTELCDAFGAAGCTNARTVMQSGNVVFDVAAEDPARIFLRIRSRIRTLTGGEPEIVFRTARQLQALVRADPFKALVPDRTLKLYAVCLAAKPARIPRFPWEQPKEGLEAIGSKGLDVLVVSRRKPSGFYGFPNAFVETILGVPATSRNWNTVVRIAALMREPGSVSS